MIDFIKCAQSSLQSYKESIGSKENYVNTLYVAISENDKVSCSYEPSVLSNAYQCILIHCRSSLAVTNYYRWYKAEFINYKGQNLGGIIGNDCHFNIDWIVSWSNQVLHLYHQKEVLYFCHPPFEGHMQGLWDAYCGTFNRGKDDIAALHSELAKKDEQIHRLEEQISIYRSMLAGVKDIIKDFEE